MDEMIKKSLNNAAASSAMEGLPLDRNDYCILQNILDGKATLQDYLTQLQNKYRET